MRPRLKSPPTFPSLYLLCQKLARKCWGLILVGFTLQVTGCVREEWIEGGTDRSCSASQNEAVASMEVERGPTLQRLAPNIWRFTKQTFYGEEVGVFLVEDDEQLIMIETPHFSQVAREAVSGYKFPAKLYLTHAATSTDGDTWQQVAGIPLHMNKNDLNDEWLRATPSVMFDGDFQITSHVRAIHLPGHSKGHTVYYDERAGGTLFSGDAILYQNGKFRLDMQKEVGSKILQLQFERMFPFHYDMVSGCASVRVHDAMQRSSVH